MATRKQQKSVEALSHDEASRKNIPTAEHQPLMDEATEAPLRVAYERRNRNLDPQLVWRGKDQQDEADLSVNAPPLYIQEKVHPKALIDELQRESREREHDVGGITPDLFADFNGLPKGADRTDFYQYDGNWQNRLILGDSLQVMASLAEREGLRGKVQCIYLDPPYGIKFNSNFQWSTTSRDVKDGKAEHITREPEQVKAFRDTWHDGIHSCLTYLRDRLTVARDLLTESGSIFVQIGDENVHRVRALMDEVFGDENFINLITFQKTSSSTSDFLGGVADYLLWYGKAKEELKFRKPLYEKSLRQGAFKAYNKVLYSDASMVPLNGSGGIQKGSIVRIDNITSQSAGRDKGEGAASWFPVEIGGREIKPSQYSGGTGSQNYRGVSTVAWHSARLAGGVGNIRDTLARIGAAERKGLAELAEKLRGNQQNAKRPDEITNHAPLTTNHYLQTQINGVDVFHPQTGEVQADGPEGIACWFIDTDYDSESFFVRHAYFLGAADPYKALKTTLKAEINEQAWETLHGDTSRAFPRPTSGRIAVKVINHLGDEVMKVFRA